MNKDSKRIIFLNSYLPRTGHNFASEVLKIFTGHQVLAHNRSETRLSSLLHDYYSIYEKMIFHDSDRKFFDHLFIDDLRNKIINHSESDRIMIKNTSFLGVEKLPIVFPDDHHIVLIRDPKNVFLSLLRGMNLQKKSGKNLLKKIGFFTGLYPYYYSKKLSGQVLKNIPVSTKHFVIRYEDLVKKEEKVLILLKKKFGTNKTIKQIRKEIEEIQVINSSFFREVKAGKIWDMKPKSRNFDPLNRKGANWIVRIAVEMGSKKLRQELNYI